MSRRAAARRALLPGDGRVWLVAALLGSLFAVGIAIAVLTPRDHYTGTSSVRLRSFPFDLAAGQRLCVPQLIPGGSGRMELWVSPIGRPRPALEATVEPRGRAARPARVVSPPLGYPHKVLFEFDPLPDEPRAVEGTVCVRSLEARVLVGGMHGRPETDPMPTVDGREAPHRVAIWYRRAGGEKRSVAALLPDIVRRAALFRPGIVGPWTYVAILALVLPGLIYAGLRLLARADDDGPRRLPLAAWIALIAFAHGACWALVTPAFNAPDEPEHFAYAQRLAETGHGLIANEKVYSADQAIAVDAMHSNSSNETGDGRTPWLQADEEEWERLSADRRPRDDAGGRAPATEAHSPLYYGSLAPVYRAADGGSAFSLLTWMRLASALYGALAAACAFGIVRELLPRRRLPAVAAGLIVAFQPMFAFMSGTVNNDMGVNGLSALLLYLVVRAYARGLTPRLGAAIGAVLVLAPLMKGTAYAIYPAALVGLAAALWRHRDRRGATGLAAAGATALGLFLAWGAVKGHFDRPTFTTPGGGAPGSDFAGVENPAGLLAYLWQVFLPPLGFMTDYWQQGIWPYFDVYVVRGWGAFGWYAMTFSDWVYWVIAFAMPLVAAGALVALARHRDRARELAIPGLVLVLAVAGVFAGVHAYYFREDPRIQFLPEQGRYLFPTIAAIATIAVASSYALGRRLVVPVATTLVVAVMGIAYAAQIMALARFFT